MNPLNTGPTGQYEVEDSPETLQNIMRVTRDQESVFKVIRILELKEQSLKTPNFTNMQSRTNLIGDEVLLYIYRPIIRMRMVNW